MSLCACTSAVRHPSAEKEAMQRLKRLGLAADLYKMQNGTYPSAEQLFAFAGDPVLALDPWGVAPEIFVVAGVIPGDTGFRLVSAGPDRVFNTPDDILFQ